MCNKKNMINILSFFKTYKFARNYNIRFYIYIYMKNKKKILTKNNKLRAFIVLRLDSKIYKKIKQLFKYFTI